MSTLRDLAVAITDRGVHPKCVMRHLPRIRAIARELNGFQCRVHHAELNFSLTVTNDARRLRLIFAKREEACRLYAYRHEHADQYKAVREEHMPEPNAIASAFTWLREKRDDS